MTHPIRFDPAMEHPPEGEAETESSLDQTLAGIRETTFKDSGQAIRSVHAKAHGIIAATLTVLDGLPPELAQGLFAKPGRYDAIMRLSTIPGDVLSDAVSVPRGMALKVLGVEGARLPGSEGDTTQDFVMADGPAFAAPTPAKFLGNLKLLAATTDTGEGAKKVLSAVARGAEAVLEAFGTKSPFITTLGGHPGTHILGETFYSQTAFLFGPYYAKFALKPVSAGLAAHTNEKVDLSDPDVLRHAVTTHFAGDGGTWALQVQLATDPDAMPIEDASAIWPEEMSPYVTVARLEATAQDAWSEANRRTVEDGFAFSPWHGLAAHRPLGGVNRVRRSTYKHSAEFRGTHTGCPMHEPRAPVAAG